VSRPRQITDEQILDTARRCFLEHGPSAPTSLIAGELGVSQAALFKRFGSKNNLLIASLKPPGRPPFVSLLEEGPDLGPLAEQLECVAHAVLEFFDRMIPCLSMLRAADVDPHEMMKGHDVPPPVVGTRAIASWVKRAQKQGRLSESVDPETFAFTFLGGLHSRTFTEYVARDHLGETERNKVVRSLVSLLLEGLEPTGET
jgi:AcrR family transcriptional regulator